MPWLIENQKSRDNMTLKENLNKVQQNLTNQTIVVATKYVDFPVIQELYDLGIRDVGENRVADMLRKQAALPHLPIKWHFIGHLQTNKVKSMINQIDCLHSLDSLKLAEAIQRNRHSKLDCFIEVKLTDEPNKTGITPLELLDFVNNLEHYDIINIIGLMGMAEANGTKSQVYQSFNRLRELRDLVRALHHPYSPCDFLSMGMSDDYQIAIQCGATHVRLGSILFRSEE